MKHRLEINNERFSNKFRTTLLNATLIGNVIYPCVFRLNLGIAFTSGLSFCTFNSKEPNIFYLKSVFEKLQFAGCISYLRLRSKSYFTFSSVIERSGHLLMENYVIYLRDTTVINLIIYFQWRIVRFNIMQIKHDVEK